MSLLEEVTAVEFTIMVKCVENINCVATQRRTVIRPARAFGSPVGWNERRTS